MVRFFAALLAATACAAVAQAQDRASPGAERLFTLDDAVAAAGGRAPLVEAAQAAVAASRAARTVAGLRPNPSIETDIENFAGTGPYRRFDETETTISQIGRAHV